jgi:uncharacterized membrane protein YcaP (DUF421 family)
MTGLSGLDGKLPGQALLALAYYLGLVLVMRLAGKRLAGQVTTFDLVVLITLGVVLQGIALRPGRANAIVFVVTVFAAHRGLAVACSRSWRLRRLVRGTPTALVRHGQVSWEALEDEGLSYEELLAGLRKLGHGGPEGVALATLEETGHISVVTRAAPAAPASPGGAPAGAP